MKRLQELIGVLISIFVLVTSFFPCDFFLYTSGMSSKMCSNDLPVWYCQSKRPLLEKKEILTFPPGDHKEFGPQPGRQNSLHRIYFNIIPFMMSLSFLNVDVVDVTLEDSVLIFFSFTFKIIQYVKIHLYVKPSFPFSLL